MKSLRQNLPVSSLSFRQWAQELGLSDAQAPLSLQYTIQFAQTEQTYEVVVQTGTIEAAGTDDDVFITVFGKWAALPERELDNVEDNFERGKRDIFQLTGAHLGPLERVRIRREPSFWSNFTGPGWFLDRITIRKVSTDQVWAFPCHRWLSAERRDAPDCAIDLILFVNGSALPNPNIKHRCIELSTGSGITPQAQPASHVQLFNCHTDHLEVHIWVLDLTTGTHKEQGSLSPQYDHSGYCPAAGARPIDIELQNEHQYLIIAVDPANSFCGANDPSIEGCRRWMGSFIGDARANVVKLSIS